MFDVRDLPGVNAVLNATAATLLVIGYVLIKNRREAAHKACMLAATVCSALFLISYLVYHAQVGSVKFQGQGTIRTVYFAILLSHTVLAVVNVPLVILTLVRAFKGDRERHKKIARITLPLWIYVSITGIVVYWMLYRM
ncbi:MAG: DUF420 domain-containing protein [Planctomycetes bacterium]|nr:DUF420 domain-containing protein [Planctomycetota bacterium]